MCTSKPKIPDSRTPPAPPPPEGSPDAPRIGDRYQELRARGLKIPVKPDLSGLGNQQMGEPVNRIQVSASGAPYDPVAEVARLNAQNEQIQTTKPNSIVTQQRWR